MRVRCVPNGVGISLARNRRTPSDAIQRRPQRGRSGKEGASHPPRLQAREKGLFCSLLMPDWMRSMHRSSFSNLFCACRNADAPTYTDTSGLGVNEIILCGLLVILSQAAGWSARIDLVKVNWKWIVAGGSITRGCHGRSCSLCMTTDANSMLHILRYATPAWSMGVAHALQSLGGQGA